MIISHAIRYLLIASLIVSISTHPMGDSFSTKAKLGIGVAAALAAFVGYRVWTQYKARRASSEARCEIRATIDEMRIFDYKGLKKFNLQAVHTAQLFNSINNLNHANCDEVCFDRIKILLNDPLKSALEDTEHVGNKILLGAIKILLGNPERYRANPDMTYQDLKAKITYCIPDHTFGRPVGEMPLEERPITLIAQKIMCYGPRDGDRLRLILLFWIRSKLELDGIDHEGRIRRIMYSDRYHVESDCTELIALLNQRRQDRRDAIHDATSFPDTLSDLVFCYDDPLMKEYPIQLRTGVPKQLVHVADSDDEGDEKEARS